MDQCLNFAVLMALKYPDFGAFAASCKAGVSCFLAALAALWNSQRRIVRCVDHQGLG